VNSPSLSSGIGGREQQVAELTSPSIRPIGASRHVSSGAAF